jgi:hypothetical protein
MLGFRTRKVVVRIRVCTLDWGPTARWSPEVLYKASSSCVCICTRKAIRFVSLTAIATHESSLFLWIINWKMVYYITVIRNVPKSLHSPVFCLYKSNQICSLNVIASYAWITLVSVKHWKWCTVLYHLDLYMNPHKPLHLPLFASTLQKQLDLFFDVRSLYMNLFFSLWIVAGLTHDLVCGACTQG